MTPAKKSENSKVRPGDLVLVCAELLLALWVLWRFDLDPAKQLGLWVFLAVPLFAVHALVPLGWRRPLALATAFGLLMFVACLTAFGLVAGFGIGLIALCHVPVAFRWRVLMVAVAAAWLAAAQLGWVYSGRHLPKAIPILGAIFMFRMVIYLYDLRHEKPGTVGFVERVGYFFLLPAPLFPFFPTLDYKVYLRCFYDRPAFGIYQTGMLWISRGTVHLVLYRLIYHFFSPPAEFINDLGGVMAYCLSGYLIYLRVSGVFHLISGFLRLFGYDLPETHRLYFFASGFSDYWRRINIYWKDFMAKVFFFPTFSGLRNAGIGRAAKVALATIAVFAATTVLHAYQTFWLRGDFTIHETDYWFWGILGALVVVNNLIDDRQSGKLPAKSQQQWSAARALVLSLKVLGMFLLLCVLWALWSSQTVANFTSVMKQALHAEPRHFAILGGFCVSALVLGVLGQWVAHRGFNPFVERPAPARSVATTVLPLVLLGGLWEYHDRWTLGGAFGDKFDAVRIDQPNERDQIQRERSYYEVIMGGAGDGAGFGDDPDEHPKDYNHDDIRGDLYKASFGPSIAWGAKWSTNEWRMRDRDYPKEKPEGVYRIAITGASYVAARGVADGKGFESILEDQLNTLEGGRKFEVLNFATSDTGTLQRLADLEIRILDFQPDAFFLVCHNGEADRNLRKLADVVSAGQADLTYPYIKELIAKAGIEPGDPKPDVIRALQPYSEEILRWTYARIVEVCEEHGITPVWIYLPLTKSHQRLTLAKPGQAMASSAGVHTIILDHLYQDYELDEIALSEADSHPTELGHRLIARRLLEKLQADREALGLPEEVGRVALPTIE